MGISLIGVDFMRRHQRNEKELHEQREELSIVASIAQLSLIVLTVVYSNDPPDAWDFAIAIFVIFLGYKYRAAIWDNSFSRRLTVAGCAISWMTIIQALLDMFLLWTPFLNSILANFPDIDKKINSPIAVLSSVFEITLTLVLYRLLLWHMNPMRRQSKLK